VARALKAEPPQKIGETLEGLLAGLPEALQGLANGNPHFQRATQLLSRLEVVFNMVGDVKLEFRNTQSIRKESCSWSAT